MTTGEKIRATLLKRGMTQDDLAAAVGWSRNADISELVNDSHRLGPRAAKLLPIARALGVSLDYLCDESIDNSNDCMTLSEDERDVITQYRLLELPAERAIKAMIAELAKGPQPSDRSFLASTQTPRPGENAKPQLKPRR